MVWAIIAGTVVVAIVLAIVMFRPKKSGAAGIACSGCSRAVPAGFPQCPFCGATVAAPAAAAPPVQGGWTQNGVPAPTQMLNGNGAHPKQAYPSYLPANYAPPTATLPPPSFSNPGVQISPYAAPVPSMPSVAGSSPMVGAASLEFIRGPLVGRVLSLAQAQDQDGSVRIGSDTANSIVLPDPSVSRRHAAIRASQQGYELADLGSTNGIYVNGAKVARHRLNPGDVIRLGGSELVFRA